MDTTYTQINNATLLLQTKDLPAYPATNDVGRRLDANSWSNEWLSLDLGGIIGQQEFDKYDYFEIQHISTIQSNNSGVIVSGTVATCNLTITGLPFINNYTFDSTSYAVPSLPKLSGDAICSELVNLILPQSPYMYQTCFGTMSASVGTVYSPFEPSPVIFSKVDVFDLKLIPRVFDSNNIPTTAKVNEMCFLFKFRGVKIEDMRTSFCLRGTLQTRTGVYVYNNFSLKQALGMLWNKYDVFTIKIVRMFHLYDGGAGGISNTDRPCYLTLKGLDFIDSKNMMTSSNKQEQVLCHLQFNNAGNSYCGFKHNTNEAVMFKKNSDLVNLEITFHNIMDGGWAYDFTRPHCFYFMITPVI